MLTFIIIFVCLCILAMIIVILRKMEKQKRIIKAAKELNKITNSIRAGLVHFVLEDACEIIYASRGFYDLLGYSKGEIRNENKSNITDFIHQKDIEHFEKIKEQFLGEIINLELRMVTKQGETLYALVNGKCEIGKNGKHIISAVFVDISEQKIMQDMLQLEGERYRVASELSKDILFEYDIKNDEMVFTGKFKDLFGRNPKFSSYCTNCEIRRDIVHPDDWGIYLEFCNDLAAGSHMIETEFRMKDRLNNFIWCQVMGKTIYDEDKIPLRVIGKWVNIDTQKRELEALEYKATRDPLTGIYNKEVTIKKIDKFISGNKTGKHALMFIDFDDFKLVNDNYGHLVGDKVLMYVIGRIKNVFSEGEIIGRTGGDEFIVFIGNIDAAMDIEEKAKILVSALNTTFPDNGLSIPVSGSIGIALYPEDGMHYEQLLQCADKAMYKVKAQGKKNYRFYSSLI